MVAIAGWLVWEEGGWKLPLYIWTVNLVYNAASSWLMFGRHRIDLALIDAVAMLVTIVGFILLAEPVSRTAALLFVPYLIWVTYAAALNYSILRRNPQAA